MPKNLQKITPASAKNIEITLVRIAFQHLLYLQSEAVHPAAHVGRPRCQPDPHVRRRHDHPRSAVITRRKVAKLTSLPTRTRLPSGKVISIVSAVALGDGGIAAVGGGASRRRTGTKRAGNLPTRRPRRSRTPPCAQQIRIHVMSRRYRPDAGAGFSRLRDDPQLVVQAPAPPSFPAVDDLDLTVRHLCKVDLKCTLRWSPPPYLGPPTQGGSHRRLTIVVPSVVSLDQRVQAIPPCPFAPGPPCYTHVPRHRSRCRCDRAPPMSKRASCRPPSRWAAFSRRHRQRQGARMRQDHRRLEPLPAAACQITPLRLRRSQARPTKP